MPLSTYRSRVAAGAALVTAAAAFALVAVHVAPVPYAARPSGAPTGRPQPGPLATLTAPAAPTGSARKPPEVSGFAWLDVVVVVAVGLVVLVSLAGMVVAVAAGLRRLGFVARRRRPRAATPSTVRPRRERDDPAALAAAVEAGLAELAGGAPDDAIVACWLRLADAARDIGVETRRSDTPDDFVARLTGTARVRPEAVDRLAALYREARFSRHAMTEDDRRSARAALEAVRADLRAGVDA